MLEPCENKYANSPTIYKKYFSALLEINQVLTSDHYLDDILKLIVMVTARVTGVEICSLWLIEEGKKEKIIRLKATQAIDQAYVHDRVLRMDEGVVGYVASTQRPLLIRDVLQEPMFKEKEMAAALGLVSMVGVPMKIGTDGVIGVLNCFTDRKHLFPESETNLVTMVANQAALAIHNTRLAIEASVIREELETRKLVDRAKEIIHSRGKMTNDEAYRWIQKKSMDSRRPMAEIAEAVILSEELMA